MGADGARNGRDWIAAVTAGGFYEIAAGPSAAQTARAAVDAACVGLSPPARQELRLLVSELVTNSVRHSHAGSEDPVELRVAVFADRLRVEVSDHGTGFQRRVPTPERGSGSGWGLYLVDQLADRWGVDRDEAIHVWFEIDRD